MSSRTNILARIRAGHPDFCPLPDVPHFEMSGDAKQSFISMLESFDGKAIEFSSRCEAVKWLEENVDRHSRSVFSAVPDFKGNFELLPTDNLHRAAQVDVCIAQGEMGVGETGSVWVTDGSLGVPAAALLSTDLYLLLDTADIVGGIHDAYSRLDLGSTPYGSFFTGPSATADIEAVRVTGAQGEISLTVLLVTENPR